jgi:hypothetical protein
MFVIVLTIIGLSLFALSSYESQFLNASLDQARAFYEANGAVDRARYLLAATQRLETVSANLGTDVDTASATQGGRDSGPVDWSLTADPVVIRVLVNRNGHTRSLEASFDPNSMEPYDRLLSLWSDTWGLVVPSSGATWYSNQATYLNGVLSQNYRVGPTWQTNISPLQGGSWLPVDSASVVPPAEVETFVDQKIGTATPAQPNGGSNNYSFDASGSSDGVIFVKSEFNPANDPNFSLNITTGPAVDIYVTGIVVWLFDHGLRSARTITVHGGVNDMLVLCARPSDWMDQEAPRDHAVYVGIDLHSGINSPNAPVILVSDGYVSIDSFDNAGNDGNVSSTVSWMNIYAPQARIRGPNGTGGAYDLRFVHPMPYSPAENNLQKLVNLRDLPNAEGPRHYLTLKAGTWRDDSN